jgi:hypothetical protein
MSKKMLFGKRLRLLKSQTGAMNREYRWTKGTEQLERNSHPSSSLGNFSPYKWIG